VAPAEETGSESMDPLRQRASVGSLVRVLFRNRDDERTMLALERTATLRAAEGRSDVAVVAKPFGGGIRIVDPDALRTAIGDFRYDSERSRREQDFRLQIDPARWEDVKRVCRDHLQAGGGGILDPSPDRELAEELDDALGVSLDRNQYRLGPAGLFVQDTPRATDSTRAPGRPTVRVYFVFEAWLVSPELVSAILQSSRTSDDDLRAAALRQAEQGGRGRANAALALDLEQVTSTYLALPTDRRDEPLTMRGHRLAGNVPAIVDGVDPR
jgi:hypothetical protein